MVGFILRVFCYLKQSLAGGLEWIGKSKALGRKSCPMRRNCRTSGQGDCPDELHKPAPNPDADNLYERLKGRVGQVSFVVPQDLSRRTGYYFGKRLRKASQDTGRQAGMTLCDASPLVALINKSDSQHQNA